MRSAWGRGNRTGWALIRNCSGRYLHLTFFRKVWYINSIHCMYLCAQELANTLL